MMDGRLRGWHREAKANSYWLLAIGLHGLSQTPEIYYHAFFAGGCAPVIFFSLAGLDLPKEPLKIFP
ncbi:MAG: hypothetical protein ACXWB9_07055, partial [Flavisolibacter sp.]